MDVCEISQRGQVLVIDGTVVVGVQHFVAYPRHISDVIRIIVFTASSIYLPETNQSFFPYFELQFNTGHKDTTEPAQ